LGAYSYNSYSNLNGHDGVIIGIIQLSGSNANEIQIAIDKLMVKASKDFPPASNTTSSIVPKQIWMSL
jgi:HAE1 family hydrophobic/amphiphilic exporter-1